MCARHLSSFIQRYTKNGPQQTILEHILATQQPITSCVKVCKRIMFSAIRIESPKHAILASLMNLQDHCSRDVPIVITCIFILGV